MTATVLNLIESYICQLSSTIHYMKYTLIQFGVMYLASHVIGWLFIRLWLPQFCCYWKYLWKSYLLKFGILHLHNMSSVANINSHSPEYSEKEDCHMGLDMWCIDDGGEE